MIIERLASAWLPTIAKIMLNGKLNAPPVNSAAFLQLWISVTPYATMMKSRQPHRIKEPLTIFAKF